MQRKKNIGEKTLLYILLLQRGILATSRHRLRQYACNLPSAVEFSRWKVQVMEKVDVAPMGSDLRLFTNKMHRQVSELAYG